MSRWRTTGRWSLTALLLAVALYQAPPGQFARHFREIDPLWAGVAALMMVAIVLVATWKWSLLLAVHRVRPGFVRLLYYYAVGYFFNSFLTGSGDLKRAADLGAEQGRIPEVFASVLAERWTGVMGQLGLASATLLVASLRYPGLRPLLLVCAGLGVAAAGGYLWMENARPPRAPAAGGLFFAVTSWIHGVRRALAVYRDHRGLVAWALLLSLAGPILLVLIHWALGRALHLDLPLLLLFFFVPTISVFAQLPVAVNGLGVQDVSMISLLGLGGIAGGVAMALSVAFHLLRLGVGGGGGVLYALAPELGRRGAGRLPAPHPLSRRG